MMKWFGAGILATATLVAAVGGALAASGPGGHGAGGHAGGGAGMRGGSGGQFGGGGGGVSPRAMVPSRPAPSVAGPMRHAPSDTGGPRLGRQHMPPMVGQNPRPPMAGGPPHGRPPHGRPHHRPRHYRGIYIAPPVFIDDAGYGECRYLKRRAMRTGSRYWWNRYEDCKLRYY